MHGVAEANRWRQQKDDTDSAKSIIRVAVASCTNEPIYARKCMDWLLVNDGIEIRPGDKIRHFESCPFFACTHITLAHFIYCIAATSDSDAEAAAVATDEERTGMSRRKPRESYWVNKRCCCFHHSIASSVVHCFQFSLRFTSLFLMYSMIPRSTN